MKTKVLLIGAALGLAVATASADAVYSSNVVGYVNVDLAKGWNMIANPLDSGNNMLSSVIPEAPYNTAVYKFENGAYLTPSIFDEDEEAWTIDYSLNPGEGVFINAPEAFTVTFVGEVKAGFHSVSLPAGWSIVSSPTPVAGTLEDIDLTSAVDFNDAVYKFENGGYLTPSIFDEDEEAWSINYNIAVGEAFFLKKASASVWTRGFEIK
jgi:hypothetical protein